MGDFLKLDGKVMHYGVKFAYLMWIHVLTAVCCIPVYTVGASFCAMHRVLLQIYKDEETAVTKTFFRAFFDNFRQATVLWVVFFTYFALLILDLQFVKATESVSMSVMQQILPILLVAGLPALSWIFVLQSRYHNSILGTMRLAFVVCISFPFRTIAMTVLMVSPVLLLAAFWQAVPFVTLLGFTVPGIIRARLYSRVFDKLEGSDRKKANM